MSKIRREKVTTLYALVRTYYQDIIAAAMLSLVVLIVYGHDLGILFNEAIQNEAYSHLILVPLFLGIVLYLKKDSISASISMKKYAPKIRTKYLDGLVGIIFCLIAFLMYWYGSSTFYPLEYHILTLPIFVAGMMLILFNLKVLRALIFPILFLLFLVPIPTDLMYRAGGILAELDTQTSYAMLKALNIPVALTTVVGSPTIQLTSSGLNTANFSISLPCSGVYLLIAFAMFAAFLAFVISGSLLRKSLTVVFGFLVFVIINIFRISTIVVIAYAAGEEIAMLTYHTVAGVLLLTIGMILVLFISEKLWKIKVIVKPPRQPPCSECGTSLAKMEDFCANCGRYLDPLKRKISQGFWIKLSVLLLVSALLVVSVNAPTFAVAQGPPGGVVLNENGSVSAGIFPQIPNYNLTFLYRDTRYEEIAGQDAALIYAYLNKTSDPVYVDVSISSSLARLHNWEDCLISYPISKGQNPLVTMLDSQDIQLLEGVPIIARYLVFTRPDINNLTQITLYWFEQVPFNTGITVQQKYVRISLVVLTNSTYYQAFEDELLPFGQTVARSWEPMKNQALISLGIPAQQAMLGFSVFAVAFIETSKYYAEKRKKNTNKKLFNNYASFKERIVLRTIEDLTNQNKVAKTRDLRAAISRKTGKPVRLKTLLKVLRQLEENGIIERNIVNVNNNPCLSWKS